MSQLAIMETGPAPEPQLSQWFTPPRLANALVGLVSDLLERRDYLRILEPSAGRGNLVRAILLATPGPAVVTAIDIDPRWEGDLVELAELPYGARVEVEIVDYLARPAPARRYDLAVCNVPFDGGEEGPHLAKLLDEADRIAALLPTRSLHGRTRYAQVWHRFDPRRSDRDWYIRQEARSVLRPKFGEAGGTDEIVLLDLSREPGPCIPRWL